MNWQRWKEGLMVALLTGFLTGLVTLMAVDNFTWKIWLLLVGSAAKDALLYLKDHPVDSVNGASSLSIEVKK